MPVDMEKARIAHTVDKVAIACATCERYWEAKGAGAPRCQPPTPCSGPMGGRTFPAYRGIMSGDAFRAFCFVCGARATHEVSVQGEAQGRVLGVCSAHVSTLWRYESLAVAAGEIAPPVLVLDGPDGRAWIRREGATTAPKRLRLTDVIAEVEKDEQRRRGWT